MTTCFCGSGNAKRPLYDAKMIFVAYVCDACEAKVRGRYRPEVFTEPDYIAEEPVDEDGNDG